MRKKRKLQKSLMAFGSISQQHLHSIWGDAGAMIKKQRISRQKAAAQVTIRDTQLNCQATKATQ